MLSIDALISGYKGTCFPWKCIIASKDNNMRTVYNDIDELSLSIKENGLIEPIVVKVISENPLKVQVSHGHRRYYAIEKLKPSDDTMIPCMVKEYPSPGLEKLGQLSENTNKETVKSFDIAVTVSELENKYKIRRDAISKSSGLPLSTISNLIACLKPVGEGGLSPIIIDVWRNAQRREQEIPMSRLFQWKGKSEELQIKYLDAYLSGEDYEIPFISDDKDDKEVKIVKKSPGKRLIRKWLKETNNRLKDEKDDITKEKVIELKSARRVLRWLLGELKEPI